MSDKERGGKVDVSAGSQLTQASGSLFGWLANKRGNAGTHCPVLGSSVSSPAAQDSPQSAQTPAVLMEGRQRLVTEGKGFLPSLI